MAYMRWLAADYDEQQTRYLHLRQWYRGEQGVPLTDRQREYLATDSSFEWSLNYLRLPVDLCVERLTVEGFDGPPGIGGDDGVLDEWWTSSRMDALQNQVHRAAIVDGDTYLLIEWDTENGRPIFSHEPAFDGEEGVKVHYLSNLKRDMTMASKRWGETRFNDNGAVQAVQRLNLYLPDRIEKYENTGRGWTPYRANPDDAWPIAVSLASTRKRVLKLLLLHGSRRLVLCFTGIDPKEGTETLGQMLPPSCPCPWFHWHRPERGY